jgi:hypothetical protein
VAHPRRILFFPTAVIASNFNHLNMSLYGTAVHASLCRQCKAVPLFYTTGAVDRALIVLLPTVGLLYIYNCPLSTLNTNSLPEPLTTICLVIPCNLKCTFLFSYLIHDKLLVNAFLTTSFALRQAIIRPLNRNSKNRNLADLWLLILEQKLVFSVYN